MNRVDARDALKSEPFSYRADKEGKVAIYHQGRFARMLKGSDASKFLKTMNESDAFGAQLAMAKATGNFKRGNER